VTASPRYGNSSGSQSFGGRQGDSRGGWSASGGNNSGRNSTGRQPGSFFSTGRPDFGQRGGGQAQNGFGRGFTGGQDGGRGSAGFGGSHGWGFGDRRGSAGSGGGRGGHGVDPDRFYGNMLDRRIEYPGVIRPRAAGVHIGLTRPCFYHGRRVWGSVPYCGFGFFTPVVAPYPVYPAPIYETPVVVAAPGYYPPEAYGAPGPGYGDVGYGYEGGGYYGPPAYAGTAGPAPAPGEYAQAAPEVDQQAVNGPPPVGQTEGEALSQSQPQQGQEPAGQAAGPQPSAAEQQMGAGMEAFNAGQYDMAAKSFLSAAMADNDNIDAWLAYGVARFATGNYEASGLAIRRAVRAFPDVVNSPVDIRERYGRSADFDRHLAAVEAYVRNKPESADGWLVLGFARHFSGQRELAAKTFDVVRRRFTSDRDVADIFLHAKSISEIEREITPPPSAAGQGAAPPPTAGQRVAPPPAQGPAPITSEPQVAPLGPPPPPPPPAGEQPSTGPGGSAVQAEQALRDSGLVDPDFD
jgi:hypothetical protein